MSALANIYIKTDVLETLLNTVKTKGEKGLSITLSINDEVNEYGQNVVGFVTQTKEQRENKKKKFYIGNGEVVWTNGTIVKGGKEQSQTTQPQQTQTWTQQATSQEEDNLPF